MSQKYLEELCKNVIKAKIFIYEDDSINDLISIIEDHIAEIKIYPKRFDYIYAKVKIGVNEINVRIFLCYGSPQITIYISGDFSTEKSHFVYYRLQGKNIELLGLAESSSIIKDYHNLDYHSLHSELVVRNSEYDQHII